jgi:Protein of unknown function (DUF3096)
MLVVAAELLARSGDISFHLTLRGLLTLAAGVLILVMPTALNYIVAIYLIIIGLAILFDVKGF